MLSRGPVGCHAQQHVAGKLAAEVGDETVVAVWGLDEYLRLAAVADLALHVAEGGRAGLGLDREVSAEGEALAVESRGHEREQDARRPHQRYHADAAALGGGYKVGAGVGYGRTAGLGENTYRLAEFGDGAQHGIDLTGRSVFAQFGEAEVVDHDVARCGPQEAPGRAQILHHKMPDAAQQGDIGSREHTGRITLAEGDGKEVDCGGRGVDRHGQLNVSAIRMRALVAGTWR